MFKTLFIFIILSIASLNNCKGKEGDYPMDGQTIEIDFDGKKIGNTNYYTTSLKVGTPEKTFNVQIDTSVSTSWLPSIKCKNCIGTTNFYDETQSSSSTPSQNKVELEDEDGNVEGYSLYDDIDVSGFQLKQFGLLQATEVDDDFRDHYEGKLGLGYRGEIGHEFNFIEKLKYDKVISKRIFSINQVDEKTGLLTIGKLPVKDYSFCNVSSGEDLDDIYKESWVCELTHVGIFNIDEGISKKLINYTIISNGKVDFDSAYDYIALPISDRQIIEDLLLQANLECETTERDFEEINKEKLNDKYHDEEISIICKTTQDELSKKNLALSFVLQGYVYSIPLVNLFSSLEEDGKIEMLVKLINDNDAIWTFGYPFMSQFLMIFNYEDNHVGIKEIDQTTLSILSIAKEWSHWYGTYYNFFYKKINLTSIIIITTIFVLILLFVVIFLVMRALRKKNKTQQINSWEEFKQDQNNDPKRVY